MIRWCLCVTNPGQCNKCVAVILLQPRQTVLTAAGSIGQASGDLLRHMGEGETDEKFQVGRLHSVFLRCCSSYSKKDTQSSIEIVNLDLFNHVRFYYHTWDFISGVTTRDRGKTFSPLAQFVAFPICNAKHKSNSF